MATAARRAIPATIVLLPLAGLAWAALVVWGHSPYGASLHHDGAVTPAGLGLFTVGWTVMTVAMMLPTSLPVVRMFDKMTARRDDHGRLVGLLVGAYLATWTAFGVAALSADRLVHLAVDTVPAVAARQWLVAPGVLLLAGAFQFSKLKYRCLDKCRSPFMLIAQHWHGRAQARSAVALGVRHAAYCVGCCWALMLLMFAFGLANVAWMLVLAIVMAVEKNVSWGRSVGRPIGVALIAAGVLAAVAGP